MKICFITVFLLKGTGMKFQLRLKKILDCKVHVVSNICLISSNEPFLIRENVCLELRIHKRFGIKTTTFAASSICFILRNKSNYVALAKRKAIAPECKSVQRNYYFISILVRIGASFLSGIPYIFSEKLYKVILV